MFLPIQFLLTLMSVLAERRAQIGEQFRTHRDSGYSTEAVIATALLAAIAVGAIGAIGVKVLARAKSLDVGH
jgi:hypothetical protein